MSAQNSINLSMHQRAHAQYLDSLGLKKMQLEMIAHEINRRLELLRQNEYNGEDKLSGNETMKTNITDVLQDRNDASSRREEQVSMVPPNCSVGFDSPNVTIKMETNIDDDTLTESSPVTNNDGFCVAPPLRTFKEEPNCASLPDHQIAALDKPLNIKIEIPDETTNEISDETSFSIEQNVSTKSEWLEDQNDTEKSRKRSYSPHLEECDISYMKRAKVVLNRIDLSKFKLVTATTYRCPRKSTVELVESDEDETKKCRKKRVKKTRIRREVWPEPPIKNTDKKCHVNALLSQICQLCPDGKYFAYIVSHYVKHHKANEVYSSRLEEETADRLRASKSLPIYECVFCQECHIGWTRERWILHFTMFTGEYMYECRNHGRVRDLWTCRKKPKCKTVWELPGKSKTILMSDIKASLCDLCNWIQLSEAKVITHLRNEHDLTSPDDELKRQFTTRVILLPIPLKMGKSVQTESPMESKSCQASPNTILNETESINGGQLELMPAANVPANPSEMPEIKTNEETSMGTFLGYETSLPADRLNDTNCSDRRSTELSISCRLNRPERNSSCKTVSVEDQIKTLVLTCPYKGCENRFFGDLHFYTNPGTKLLVQKHFERVHQKSGCRFRFSVDQLVDCPFPDCREVGVFDFIGSHYREKHEAIDDLDNGATDFLTENLLLELSDGRTRVDRFLIDCCQNQSLKSAKEISDHIICEFERKYSRKIDLPSFQQAIECVKVVFENGLTLKFKHLVNTSFGASLNDEFLNASLKYNGNIELSSDEFDAELSSQIALKNFIYVVGIPKTMRENVVDFFAKLCTSCLGITYNFIYHIRRISTKCISVKLDDYKVKAHILRKSRSRKLHFADVLPPGTEPNNIHTPIYINHQYTPHFYKLESIARRAVTTKAIQSYFISPTDGFMVNTAISSTPVAANSERELRSLIDESRKSVCYVKI